MKRSEKFDEAKALFVSKTGTFALSRPAGIVDPKVSLLLLAKQIPWKMFEQEFAPLYAELGRPAKSIRLMGGLLLLKQIESLSDERVVEVRTQNPYYQALCGMEYFQWDFPCASTDLVHFRKRIDQTGMEKIFKASVMLHDKKAFEREVVVDTTVQEKNIIFPPAPSCEGRQWRDAGK